MKKQNSFQVCMQFARDMFDEKHDFAMRDLQNLFPEDSKDKSGQPFWSGPKRFPTAAKFDADD